MPLSKRRKNKKGKPVGNGQGKSRIDENSYADQPSGLTLQDLINVVAYQEYQKDGAIDPETVGDPADNKIIDTKENI